MNEFYNAIEAGCAGDGVTDDTLALQGALDRHSHVFLPAGKYLISRTLRLHSGTHIEADPGARVIYIARAPMTIHDFLLTNDDTMFGNTDISIDGGIWDGGNSGKFNVKEFELYKIGGPSGACLNFVGVKGLTLTNMEITNTISFYVRMSRVKDFVIKNIVFSSEKMTSNQDGLHFGGMVFDGVIENLRATTPGQTGDDMIAFNADDSVHRHDNRGLNCGPIENITVRGVYAESCMCAFRFASVTAPIRNIHISDADCGCWGRAINGDAARYCRTPLFIEQNAPGGVGCIENVTLENCSFHFTRETDEALINIESHADNFKIKNLARPANKDQSPKSPSLLARNLVRQKIVADGKAPVILGEKSEVCVIDRFTNLEMDYTRPEK